MNFKQSASDANASNVNYIEANDDVSISIMPENDLQSLGFIVNNGRPRFKLDDLTIAGSTLGITVVDEDDTLSFEVLGKDSLHVIKELSHASYVDIQQKSKSIDYSSMVSALTSNQIQNKLTELLQENVQLKETLKQNNIAMKQQFNVLAMWQEEVMRVHKIHKQKFVETRELIHHLKKETAELKLKLSASQCSNADDQFKDMDLISYLPKTKNDKQPMFMAKCAEKPFIRIIELGYIKQLLQDIHRYFILFSERNSELRKAVSLIQDQNFEINILETGVTKNDNNISNKCSVLHYPPGNADIHTWIEKYLMKDEEINHLKETILLLEQKLQYDLTSLQQSKQDIADNSVDCRQQFVQNVKQCEEKLQNLTDCFVTQISHSACVQECVKNCIDTLESCNVIKNLEQYKTPSEESTVLLPEEMKSLKEKILMYHRRLVDEQVKIITDRQNILKVVKEFRKLFSGYNSILYELEILQEENIKLNMIQGDATHEILQKMGEFDRSRKEEIQSLKMERYTIAREKQNLDEEKKFIDSKRKILDEERNSVENEKQLLLQERVNLHQERMSLDLQSQLYENHEKALRAEKKMLEEHHEKLLARTNELEADSQIVAALRKQIADQLQDIEILRMQLSIYEEDFKHEKKSAESSVAEKFKLTDELRRQVQMNKQAQKEIERLRAMTGQHSLIQSQQQNQSTFQNDDNIERLTDYCCPKCERSFSCVGSVEEHVETCLNLR